ncbi:MAG: tetratricopeptide repeat protein [Myxococcota bacterium]
MIGLIAMMVAWTTPAMAQDPLPENAESQARSLYSSGNDHYAAGRYELAAENFKEAYALVKRPAFLFNLANVYERLGDYEVAADYLQRYLASSRVHDVASVRERLRRLELAIATAEAEAPIEPKRPASAAVPASPLANETDPPTRRKPGALPVITAGSLAVGATATAVTFGLMTQRNRTQASNLCGTPSIGDFVCHEDAEPLLDRQRRYSRVADVSAGVAAVAAVSTAVLLVTRTPRKGKAVSVVPRFGTVAGFDLLLDVP